MINFHTLYPVFLSGEYLREDKPKIAAKQHTVFEVHVDTSWNMLCVDRRRNSVFYK